MPVKPTFGERVLVFFLGAAIIGGILFLLHWIASAILGAVNRALWPLVGAPLGVTPAWWALALLISGGSWRYAVTVRREKEKRAAMSPEELDAYLAQKELEKQQKKKLIEQDLMRRQHEKNVADAELRDFYSAQIDPHLSELIANKRKLIKNLGYGKMDSSAWEREKLNFFHNHIKHKSRFGRMSSFDVSRLIDLKTDTGAVSMNLPAGRQSGIAFEGQCAERLRRAGWTVRVTQASGDHGADLLANKHGRHVAIQCKYYSSAVGNSAVQEIHAAKAYYGCKYAAVVSNNGYTNGARALASATNVLLLDVSELADLERRLTQLA